MALIMFLKDKALDIALTIDETPLKTKKADAPSPETKVGVELLIAKLDEIYLESDDTLGKYERFENLRRISEQRMTEFILIFESLERELKTEGVTLPELVLAYKLLKAANLSNADEKLARATCTAMTMEDMKKSLMRLDDSQLKKSKAEGSDSLPVNSINKNYWNVISEDGRASGVNLDKVDWLLKKDPPLIVEPNENEETIKFAEMISEEVFVLRTSPNKSENFEQSREVEIQSWKNFGVYKEVNKNDYPSHIPLSCTWVKSEKENNGHKSRLCIRGFEEENPPKADSPTAGKDTLRMFLGLAAANSWKIEMIDIRAAFLQSDPLDRVILLKPPKQFRKDSDTLWLLLKPVYGLNDASRCWFLTAKRLLEKLGCKCLSLDYSVYIYHDSEGKLAGFLVIHVDDFLVGGNSEFKRNVIDELMKILKISCREQDNFRYIGWDISQNEDGIEIDQNAYKELIETVKISNHRRNQPDHELSDYEKKQYQQVLGQLTWITSQSRPDVRFKVLECSLKSNKPTVADLIQINQVVLKLKKTSYNIHLPILSKDPSKYNIMAFSDASVNNLKPDRVESTKASIIFLECDGKVIPLTWS